MSLDELEKDFQRKLMAFELLMGIPSDLAALSAGRMMDGHKQYGSGEWLLASRDLVKDTDEEIADTLNYIASRMYKYGQDKRLRQAVYHLVNMWSTLHDGVDQERGGDSEAPVSPAR